MNRNILDLANKHNFTDFNIEDMQPGFEGFVKELLEKAGKLADTAEDGTKPSKVIKDYFGLDK